jgi:hypothetical protein
LIEDAHKAFTPILVLAQHSGLESLDPMYDTGGLEFSARGGASRNRSLSLAVHLALNFSNNRGFPA